VLCYVVLHYISLYYNNVLLEDANPDILTNNQKTYLRWRKNRSSKKQCESPTIYTLDAVLFTFHKPRNEGEGRSQLKQMMAVRSPVVWINSVLF
jgi:hypothetical protein